MSSWSKWWWVAAGAASAVVGPARAQEADSDQPGAPERLEEIVVRASSDASAGGLKAPYAGGQVARGGRVGLFGALDLMDTPFSITSYTQKLIQDQQAASIGDVLQNDPAVRVARGFGNFQQTYIVRGLPIFSDDMSYNGLYGLLPRQYLAAELVERVEVLRGASAFLNGAAPGGSGLGGAINVMPKRATNESLTEVTLGGESGAQGYGAIDVARRFGPDRALGLRLNGVRRDGGTAVDGEKRTLSALAVGVDYHVGDLRVSADIGYQNHHLERSQPSVTIASTLAIPSAPDASHNLGQPWTFSNERDTFGTVRAEYDLAPQVTLYAAAGMREGNESATFANPTVIAADGTMNAYRFDNTRKDKITTGELGVRGRFSTAGVTHNVVASVAGYEARSKNAYALSDFSGFDSNLYAPVEVAAPMTSPSSSGGVLSQPRLTDRTRTSSAAIADMLGFLDDRLLVSLGGRYQKIASTSYDYNTGAEAASYSKGRMTPVGGVVFKASRQVSVYANYIEGLVKGDTAPTTFVDPSGATRPVVNAGEVFQPYQSKQQEVGVKLDTGRLGAALGVFATRKPIASVDASGRYAINDHQKNRGVELSAYGELARGLKVLGGATYLDADVSGNDAIGSPKSQYNLGLEWDIPYVAGLSVDGRAVHTTKQFADAANTQVVPAWSRFDIGARWRVDVMNRELTLRARIENLTNRSQWVSVGGFPGSGYLVLGTPRTFIGSASVAF